MSKIGNYVIAMEEEGNFFYNEKEKRYERRRTEKERRSPGQGKDATSTRCKRRGSKGVLNRKEQRSRKHYRRILLLGQEPRIRKLPINRRK